MALSAAKDRSTSQEPAAARQIPRRQLSPSFVQLALWRMRSSWGLLLMTAVALIAAVAIACTSPLYSAIAMTAEVRNTFNANPQSEDMVIQGDAEQISLPRLQTASRFLDGAVHSKLGSYFGTARLSILAAPTFIVAAPIPSLKGSLVQLVSEPADQLAAHATLLAGHFPTTFSAGLATTPPTLEVAITPAEARLLHATVGSTIVTQFPYVQIPTQRVVQNAALRIVGIFSPGQDAAFWQQQSFQILSLGSQGNHSLGNLYPLLTSTEGLAALFDHFGQETPHLVLDEPATLSWTYRLDPDKATINDLNNLLNGLSAIGSSVANAPLLNQAPYVERSQLVLSNDVLTELDQIYQQISVASVPVFSLLALVIALVLFSVVLMTNLLVDRQSEVVAILRSRGASRLQIFGSFLVQGFLLTLLALIIGPPLALLLVMGAERFLLPSNDQAAAQILTRVLPQTLLLMSSYAVGAALAGLLTMALTIERATRSDVLTLRRETARTGHRPLWQRFYLDLAAVLLVLLGYGISLYMQHSNILDLQAHLILLQPLTLLDSALLAIAGTLLLLRLFPLLLSWGADLAARQRGAAPMLALAQLARSPGQALRTTLMLAITTASLLFSLVLLASQQQRIEDRANFEAGADFSGPLAHPGTSQDLKRLTAAYGHLPGVLAASAGLTMAVQGGNTLEIPIQLYAVDTTTFAQAALWTAQDSDQSLASLMKLLRAAQEQASDAGQIAAIVDANAAQALHLIPQMGFTLSTPNGIELPLIDAAEVHFIPTIGSSTVPSGSASDYIPEGGVLVDYQALASMLARTPEFPGQSGFAPLNYVWLKTVDDPKTLTALRSQLNAGPLQLDPLEDRRALSEAQRQQALYLNLIGMLTIGTTTALLLAIFGSLVASWLNVRSRLTSFALMRALGTSPGQLAAVLMWEQSMIYSAALVLGLAFGLLLTRLAVPAMVFSGAANGAIPFSAGAFYVAQSVPPIQIIFPPWLLAVPAGLILLCGLALGIMVRIALRPSIGQLLRLNED